METHVSDFYEVRARCSRANMRLSKGWMLRTVIAVLEDTISVSRQRFLC